MSFTTSSTIRSRRRRTWARWGWIFQVAGLGDFSREGSTDMILRNRNTGQYELYDIVNNQITSASNLGTVGLDFPGRGSRRLQPGRLDRHDAAQQEHGPI